MPQTVLPQPGSSPLRSAGHRPLVQIMAATFNDPTRRDYGRVFANRRGGP